MNYCPNCGEKIEEGSRFCRFCGTRIKVDEGLETERNTDSQIYYSKESPKKSKGCFSGCLLSALIIGVVLFIIFAFVMFYLDAGLYDDPNAGTTETQQMSEEEYKAACVRYTYDDILRNPDTLKGQSAVITGDVLQVLEDTTYDGRTVVYYRINIPDEDDLWFDAYLDPNDVVVEYYPQEGESRILQDDKVTIWGELNGIGTYTIQIIETERNIPKMIARYIQREG